LFKYDRKCGENNNITTGRRVYRQNKNINTGERIDRNKTSKKYFGRKKNKHLEEMNKQLKDNINDLRRKVK